eukprot:227865_1
MGFYALVLVFSLSGLYISPVLLTMVKQNSYQQYNIHFQMHIMDDNTTQKVTIPSISINHVLNILIVVPINYKYNIIKHMNDLEYNSNKFNVYWYFNIYNFNDCNSTLYDCGKFNILNNSHSNIKITTYPWRNKVAFKMNCMNPNDKWINDLSIDYIWFTDSDLLLQYFNFNSFIQLSYNLNAPIS